MARRHGSTAQQRAVWVSQLLAGSGTHGLVTLLSRTAGVSRQTLYTWGEQARAALERVFELAASAPGLTQTVERQVLSLLVEAHAKVRGIQTSLWQVARQPGSLGTDQRDRPGGATTSTGMAREPRAAVVASACVG